MRILNKYLPNSFSWDENSNMILSTHQFLTPVVIWDLLTPRSWGREMGENYDEKMTPLLSPKISPLENSPVFFKDSPGIVSIRLPILGESNNANVW